jgi:competence protein ComEA
MKHKFAGLTATLLLFSTTGPAPAQTDKPSTAAATAAGTAKPAARKHKPVARKKLVDINSAGAAQLQKLPGLDAETAKKIIAGRPYCTKAALVTENVVDSARYRKLQILIMAKLPYKDGAKNVAWCSKKKKP